MTGTIETMTRGEITGLMTNVKFSTLLFRDSENSNRLTLATRNPLNTGDVEFTVIYPDGGTVIEGLTANVIPKANTEGDNIVDSESLKEDESGIVLSNSKIIKGQSGGNEINLGGSDGYPERYVDIYIKDENGDPSGGDLYMGEVSAYLYTTGGNVSQIELTQERLNIATQTDELNIIGANETNLSGTNTTVQGVEVNIISTTSTANKGLNIIFNGNDSSILTIGREQDPMGERAIEIKGSTLYLLGENNEFGSGTTKISGDQCSLAATKVFMTGLPTADPSNANQLWNNAGILSVSAGF